MKKRTIRVIAVALCLAMCLGLTACGASLGAMLTVRKCLKALSDASNVSFTYHADGEAEIAGEYAAVSLDGDGVWYTSPFALSLNADAKLGEIGSVSAPIIMTNEDGRLVTYYGLTPAGEPLWIKTAKKDNAADMPEFDLMTVLALYSQSSDVRIEDDEQDAALLRVSIMLPGRLLAPEAEQEPDDLPVTVWIDKKSSLPTKLTADLAPLVQQRLDASEKSYTDVLKLKTLPVEITITGVDSAEKVKLPDASRVLFDLSVEKEPEPEPTPEPTAEPTPEPTAEPTAEPSAEPTPATADSTAPDRA